MNYHLGSKKTPIIEYVSNISCQHMLLMSCDQCFYSSFEPYCYTFPLHYVTTEICMTGSFSFTYDNYEWFIASKAALDQMKVTSAVCGGPAIDHVSS